MNGEQGGRFGGSAKARTYFVFGGEIHKDADQDALFL